MTNATSEEAAAPAAARDTAPQPPPQPDGQHKPWWPSSVIDRQAAQALARLLGAHAAGRGGASIKVRTPRSLVGHACWLYMHCLVTMLLSTVHLAGSTEAHSAGSTEAYLPGSTEAHLPGSLLKRPAVCRAGADARPARGAQEGDARGGVRDAPAPAGHQGRGGRRGAAGRAPATDARDRVRARLRGDVWAGAARAPPARSLGQRPRRARCLRRVACASLRVWYRRRTLPWRCSRPAEERGCVRPVRSRQTCRWAHL